MLIPEAKDLIKSQSVSSNLIKIANNTEWFNNVCVSFCLDQWNCKKDTASNRELD